MADAKIIEEKPLPLIEIKEVLEEIEKRDGELNFRSNKVKEYLDVFAQKDLKKTKDLIKKIKDLNIPRLKETQIVKIIDIGPKDLDSLRTVLISEDTPVRQEDLSRILEVLKWSL